jgi:ribosomal protein S18 acetylase RimI-like enzyme
MDVLIRPATPEDVSEVTQLMYMAAKSNKDTSLYDIMIPGSMAGRLEMLGKLFLANARSYYHYSHYLVAVVKDKVAGSLCGYNELEAGAQKLGEAFKEIGVNREEGKAMLERMQPFFRVNYPHPEDAWIVEHVAVFPQFRGNGVVQLLLDQVIQIGRDLGYRHAELGMLIGNTSAQRAYEKAGFVAADERTDPEFERIFKGPGMVRMVKELF